MHVQKNAVQETTIIDKNNIDNYIRRDEHREYRPNHTNKIAASILKGVHPEGNITVNRIGKKNRVIDGNHRIDAIRKNIALDPNFSIELDFSVYKDLTLTEEVEKYQIIANSKPESTLDKIKGQCSQSLFHQWVKDNGFAITPIYGNPTPTQQALSVTTILSPYIFRNQKTIFSNKNLISNINNLNYSDLTTINNFLIWYKAEFGDCIKTNGYYRSNLFASIGKIYYNNVLNKNLTAKELAKRVKDYCRRFTSIVDENASSGIVKSQNLYESMVYHMSKPQSPLTRN
jgi:hypothetical protein